MVPEVWLKLHCARKNPIIVIKYFITFFSTKISDFSNCKNGGQLFSGFFLIICLFFKTSNVHLPGEKYIYDLIAKGENLNTDFKFEISDSRKIARSVSAFANTEGGRLLVGVKDNGKIAGIRSEEEYYMIQAATSLYLKPRMNPEYRNWNLKGLHVLEIIVPKSENNIYYAQDEHRRWKSYVRIHDQNHIAPHLLEIIWKKKNKKGILLKYSVAESCLLQMISENVSVKREQFKKKALVSDSEADEILSDLVSIHVLQYFFQENDLRFSLAPGFRLEQYFNGE